MGSVVIDYLIINMTHGGDNTCCVKGSNDLSNSGTTNVNSTFLGVIHDGGSKRSFDKSADGQVMVRIRMIRILVMGLR